MTDRISARNGAIIVWADGVRYEVVDEQWSRYLRDSKADGYDPYVRAWGYGNRVPAGGCNISNARLAEAARLMGDL